MSECKAKVKKAAESVRKYDSIIRWQLSNLKNQMVTALFVLKHIGFLLELFRFWISCCYNLLFRIQKIIHVAIIGGGIGGVALAVACLHRGFRLPFTNAITASKLDLRAMDSLCNKLVKQSKDWVFLIRKE
jgi:NADPH-dependent 2,4-dienoyl-CoA reductase/sulfur reductase-like enzyme